MKISDELKESISLLFLIFVLLFIEVLLGEFYFNFSTVKITNQKWISYANNRIIQMDGNQYRVIRLNKEPRLDE